MSVATAEQGLAEEPVVRDAMSDGIVPRGVALSVALHLILGSLFILGLPRLFAPPTPEVEAVLEKAIQSLERAGATLKPGWPPGVQSAELLDNYRFLLDAYAFSVAPPGEQIAVRAVFANSQKPQSTGGTNNWFVGASAALCSFAEWQRQNLRRLEFRSLWQAYFDQVDVFLAGIFHDFDE